MLVQGKLDVSLHISSFRSHLNEISKFLLIGRYGPPGWPARLHGLALLEFFLRGFLKNQVCRTSVRNLSQLKLRITTPIRALSQEIHKNIWGNIENQCSAVFRQSDRHVNHKQHPIKLL